MENAFPSMAYKPSHDSFGIYAILNRENSKMYIGSAVNFLRRWRGHSHGLSKRNHFNRFLQSAFNKNPEAFEFFVVEEITDKKLLLDREQFWMDFYRTASSNFGYNLRPKSKSNLGIKFGAKTRIRIGLSLKGKPGRRLGFRHSQEEKDRIREKRMGTWLSGEDHPMWGRKQNPESMSRRTTLRRIKGTYGRPIIQMDMNGFEIQRFPSMVAAATYFNRPKSSHIGHCALGKKKSAYGFKWAYSDMENKCG